MIMQPEFLTFVGFNNRSVPDQQWVPCCSNDSSNVNIWNILMQRFALIPHKVYSIKTVEKM